MFPTPDSLSCAAPLISLLGCVRVFFRPISSRVYNKVVLFLWRCRQLVVLCRELRVSIFPFTVFPLDSLLCFGVRGPNNFFRSVIKVGQLRKAALDCAWFHAEFAILLEGVDEVYGIALQPANAFKNQRLHFCCKKRCSFAGKHRHLLLSQPL